MSIKKRKTDHLKLAGASQRLGGISMLEYDLTYEPLLGVFPDDNFSLKQKVGKKTLKHPLWISSMTGGGEKSGKINTTLAKVAGEMGIGMGLGSCRVIMENPKSFKDFDVKRLLRGSPFWANLGICQVDELLRDKKRYELFAKIMEDLGVDGLIVHINPTQEFLQKNGSIFKRNGLEILKDLLEKNRKFPLMVKEVGQGIGPKSLSHLSQLDLQGIEFGSLGGTNFSHLELISRGTKSMLNGPLMDLTKLGHSAKEMVTFWNKIRALQDKATKLDLWHVIISGGRGTNLLEDVGLAKKLSKRNSFSIGLGYKALLKSTQGEKILRAWLDEYLRAFYYLWLMTETLE